MMRTLCLFSDASSTAIGSNTAAQSSAPLITHSSHTDRNTEQPSLAGESIAQMIGIRARLMQSHPVNSSASSDASGHACDYSRLLAGNEDGIFVEQYGSRLCEHPIETL